eukprot:4810027-Amphidinium_carterae.1
MSLAICKGGPSSNGYNPTPTTAKTRPTPSTTLEMYRRILFMILAHHSCCMSANTSRTGFMNMALMPDTQLQSDVLAAISCTTLSA